MLIFVLVSVISAFYFSVDLKKINESVMSPLSEKWQKRLVGVKDIILDTVVKYLRSYFIIMLITFSILIIGFLILGVKYYFVLSALFAAIDILPVLGVGTMLIPWGIFSLATGNFKLGMGLLVLYAVIIITRQILEPKIIGVSLGIHPLLTLFSMYLGFTLFGIGGMILAPLVTLIIKSAVSGASRYRSSSTLK
jgi:sporulation integral membrane protein YtvI